MNFIYQLYVLKTFLKTHKLNKYKTFHVKRMPALNCSAMLWRHLQKNFRGFCKVRANCEIIAENFENIVKLQKFCEKLYFKILWQAKS